MSAKLGQAWGKMQMSKSIVGATLAIVLLTAVPAFAIVFGNLRVLVNRATGDAPQALVDDDGFGTTTVDMGVADAGRPAVSVVVLRRSFRVERLSGRGERVGLARSFTTEANGTRILVNSIIVPNGPRIPLYNQSARGTRFLGEDRFASRFLRAGNYTLISTITYIKSRNGFWDNSVSGSPHTFTVSAI